MLYFYDYFPPFIHAALRWLEYKHTLTSVCITNLKKYITSKLELDQGSPCRDQRSCCYIECLFHFCKYSLDTAAIRQKLTFLNSLLIFQVRSLRKDLWIGKQKRFTSFKWK